MANETVARRYADAIFDLASEQRAVERVGTDLDAVAAAIRSNSHTTDFFLAPIIDRSEKERLLLTALRDSAHDVALHALLLLVRKRRMNLLGEIVKQYRVLELRARGVEPLTIMSAREIAPRERDAMLERLERIYAKKFDVTVRHDPKLIGGVRIAMGDRRIDGSILGRLEDLSRTLFAQGAQ